MINIQDIFRHKPPSWGLRGDPFLWNELCDKLSDEKIETYGDFRRKLKKTYKKIISEGKPNGTGEIIKMGKYPREGMSGGMISNTWWVNEGIPNLLHRCEGMILKNYSPVGDISILFSQGGMIEFARTGRYPEKLSFYSFILDRHWTHRVEGGCKSGTVRTRRQVLFDYEFTKGDEHVLITHDDGEISKIECDWVLSD